MDKKKCEEPKGDGSSVTFVKSLRVDRGRGWYPRVVKYTQGGVLLEIAKSQLEKSRDYQSERKSCGQREHTGNGAPTD